MSRPSLVVFAPPSVSGGSGTAEGLNFRQGQLLVRLRAAGVFVALWVLDRPMDF